MEATSVLNHTENALLKDLSIAKSITLEDQSHYIPLLWQTTVMKIVDICNDESLNSEAQRWYWCPSVVMS